MIYSMTAFAREQYSGPEGELIWELRSVNHRYLEISLHLPEELRSLETVVREHIGQKLQRGKLDCTLRYQPRANQQINFTINHALVKGLHTAASEIVMLLASTENNGVSKVPYLDPMRVMSWPGVLYKQSVDLSPIQAHATSIFDQALDNLAITRHREGNRLETLLRQRCQEIIEHVNAIRPRIPVILDNISNRLTARLQEVIGQLDPLRVEQEIVLFVQRLDIDEELDRLITHVNEVERVMTTGGRVGRRLDFLMQELNREANTISAKIGDTEVTHHAVDIKVLIEQMREQIQNLE
ncbi:hypothetical protein TI03_04040 [Achromatium sp. WMS1]|nr:hypothetical protein TI03_04040 [Achromatium sp. WMS1]